MTITPDVRESVQNGSVVSLQRSGEVAWIRINRSEKLNALSSNVVTDIDRALDEVEDDTGVKVVVIAGAENAFSVGYDLVEEIELGLSTAEEWHAALSRNVALSMRVWEFDRPVIAAVSGWCLAGGCELAMACDLIVANDSARFGEPEIRFGSGPVTLLMPFLLGQKKTNELLLTGDVIDAQQALDAGLVNRVVTTEQLEATTSELADKIARAPLSVLRMTKRTLTKTYEAMGLRTAVSGNLDTAAVLNSLHSEERDTFTRLIKEQSLGAALHWRDERYGKI